MLTVDAVELVVVVVGAGAALVVGVLALQDAELKQHHRLVCHHHHQQPKAAIVNCHLQQVRTESQSANENGSREWRRQADAQAIPSRLYSCGLKSYRLPLGSTSSGSAASAPVHGAGSVCHNPTPHMVETLSDGDENHLQLNRVKPYRLRSELAPPFRSRVEVISLPVGTGATEGRPCLDRVNPGHTRMSEVGEASLCVQLFSSS